MKLEKITTKAQRRYHDACGTAHGLDLLGERWALLVVRELLLGPRRFGDLRRDLPGLSANVLSQRLEGLEAAGVIQRRRLPPPASVQVYALTDWGLEAAPVVRELGRWAARSPGHDPALPLSPVSIMLSFQAMFDPLRAGATRADIGFVFDENRFRAAVADGRLTSQRVEVFDTADAVVTTHPEALAACVYGEVPAEALEAQGMLSIEGDRAAFAAFAACFALPPKAGAARSVS